MTFEAALWSKYDCGYRVMASRDSQPTPDRIGTGTAVALQPVYWVLQNQASTVQGLTTLSMGFRPHGLIYRH